jgi:alpha-D-ribose 1-methylphosphonate 5-triphosphate synthase subunit PhnG
MSSAEITPEPAAPHAARKRWMSVLARAAHAEISALLANIPELPAHTRLRGPESGLVMVRGQAGGAGAAFNLGEMSVTRCTVRDADGRIGHAYVSGRDFAQSELAARLDAVLQDQTWHERIEHAVIAPLAEAQAATRRADARKAAATRVQFFTLATMRSGS